MRFKKTCPRHGDTKIVWKFLWLPMTLLDRDVYETRWLERAAVEYVYDERYAQWRPMRFV